MSQVLHTVYADIHESLQRKECREEWMRSSLWNGRGTEARALRLDAES